MGADWEKGEEDVREKDTLLSKNGEVRSEEDPKVTDETVDGPHRRLSWKKKVSVSVRTDVENFMKRNESSNSLPEMTPHHKERILVAAPDSVMGTLFGATSHMSVTVATTPGISDEIMHLRESRNDLPNVVTLGADPNKPTLETDAQLVVMPTISTSQAFMNIKKSIVGITVFTLPYACRTAGIGTVLIALCVISLAAMHASNQLIDVRRRLKDDEKCSRDASYITVADAAFGKGIFGHIVAACVAASIVATGIGGIVGFIDFFTTMGRQWGHDIGLEHARLRFWMPMAFGVVETPLVLQRSMILISHANMISLLAFICCAILVVVNLLEDAYKHGLYGHYDLFRFSSYERLFDAVGKVIFIITFHQTLYPIVSAMRKPVAAKSVINSAVGSSWALCVVYGVIGYMILGRRAEEVVFDSLSSKTISYICKVLIAIEGICALPLAMVCSREVLESLVIDGVMNRYNPGPTAISLARAVVRLTTLWTCVALSILVPEFSKAVDIVAGVPTCMLCFALPALFHAVVIRPHWTIFIFNILLFIGWMLVGFALTGSGLYHAISAPPPVHPEVPPNIPTPH